jgi:uncharacterized protein with HEPN domain
MLSFVEERIKQTIERCGRLHSATDFFLSPNNMDLFDATCMRLQTIGEAIRSIDNLTKGVLFAKYPIIPWRSIIGLRNIISHEYLSIDSEEIFRIVKIHLPSLLNAVQVILKDIAADKTPE